MDRYVGGVNIAAGVVSLDQESHMSDSEAFQFTASQDNRAQHGMAVLM